jgi:peptide/nickel transport system permease protein
MATVPLVVQPTVSPARRNSARAFLAYCRRNPNLAVGLSLLLILVLISAVGPLVVNVANAAPTSVFPDQPPSADYPLGTDDQGRDLLSVLVVGLPLTLRIGFVAAGVGLLIGVTLGFIAGYQGGVVDVVIRSVVDTLMTVPGLLVLIIIADSIKGVISINLMALIVASLAWMNPTRTIRSQVLSLRERGYVQMARLSGMRGLEIIVRELIPNMLPYLAAAFVAGVAGATLASIGLEVLGLGPQNEPDLGMTIYWAISFSTLLRGLWWWWLTPIVVIAILFVGLFLLTSGLDELANPRRRKAPARPRVSTSAVPLASDPPEGPADGAVLSVRDLRVCYYTGAGVVKAVDGVTFDLKPGERFGLVGESGCGKSTTVWAIMRLISPPGQIEGGTIYLGGRRIDALSEDELRRVRLAEIALVPQGAMNSLNPVMRVKDQLLDGVRFHEDGAAPNDVTERLSEILVTVGLRPNVLSLYPHELSGGMKQRVCIASAISLSPKVILADEPTSALDVVVQRQIMQTLGQVQRRLGAAILLVGHDMGLMAQFVDRIGVMYGGRLVETGTTRDLFTDALHPYTGMLISSLATLRSKKAPHGIPGAPPSMLDVPTGCIFHPRCPMAMDICRREIPVYREVRPGRSVACHLHQPEAR